MKRLRFFFRKLRSNRRKPFLFGFLILLCLGVTIGYAFLTTTLTIDGAVNVASSRWDIHFENIDIKEGSVEATTTPTITDDTSISFAAVLENPGEFYEFTVDLVNDGTYDAKLDTITITPTLTNEQKEYFDYIVEYTENGEIKVGDALDAGTRENIKVIVQYKVNEDDSKYPGEDINFNFSVTMNYVQGKGNPVSSHQETIITFDSNGGVGTMSNQTIPADTPTSITKNTFTRENYSFNGWNTSSDGTGTKYIDEEEVSDLGEITLFAQWKVDTFPYVFRQEGICTFNGSSSNMTGEDCSDYTSEKYIDTGIKLYSEANKSKDYEIGFTIEEYEPSSNPTQATLMNTKQEASGYPGLVFRKNSDTEFELASRKTSGANEFYRFSPTGVRDVRIYRINNEIYYKIDDGERTLLNDLTQYNPTFDLNVWFGAAPANATATSAQRYFVGKMSNMYIRLGTYVDEGTYTITLNPNGGTVNPEFVSVNEGSPIGTIPTPTKELHNFLGWYTNLTNGVEVTSSYIPDGDMTIFAKWEKKPTYSITFEEDGGEEVEDKEIEQGSSIGELPIPTKTGKSFDGWYLESTYTTKVTSSYVPTGNTILYAKWSNTTFPKVFEQTGACTFNGANGTITGENCSNYVGQKYIDTGIALYSEENKDKDYEIGFTIDSYTPSNNESRATLMNTKLEATGYPGVVFRRNDATDNFALQSRKTSSANEQLTFAYNTVTSVVIYRISNEVYYSINGGEKTLLNNLTEYNPTFNLTTWFGAAPSNEAGTSAQRYLTGTLSNMYIKLGTYEEVGKYTITLNPNGGEVTPTTKKITQGDSIGTLPTPTREGYYFDGWYTGLTDGVEVTSDYIPENSMPIYARWKKSVASMIINPEEINVDINEEQMINITNSNEIEEELTFTSNNSSIATVDNYGKVTGISTGETSITITGVISGDTKIINVFVNQYKIMLNPNGGTVTPTSIRINKGEAIGTIQMPSYSGFVFDGWYTGLTDGIEVDSSYVPTDNITIYARWTIDITLYNVLKTAAEEGTYAKEFTGSHHDSFTEEPSQKIYHWYGSNDANGTAILDKNNVIFANYCWQMIRTTDTGGVKMIYNGVPNSGVCNNQGVDQQIGTSAFNNNYNSLAYVGYMYNPNTLLITGSSEAADGSLFGAGVTYSDGTYTLTNTSTTYDYYHHYTCNNSTGTCSTVRYYHYKDNYVKISDGRTIDECLEDMLSAENVNQTDSTIKNVIDTWYQNNMTSYTEKLEDTIFCNDRGIESLGGWGSTGGNKDGVLIFNNYYAYRRLICTNTTDSFSLSNDKAKLTYPVGLISAPEMLLLNNKNLIKTGQIYWMNSPMSFQNGSPNLNIVDPTGAFFLGMVAGNFGVRPSVSLKPGTEYTSGDGSMTNPFIVE